MTPTSSNLAFKKLETAKVALATGLFDKARQAIESALELDPQSSDVRIAAARTYLRLGQKHDALQMIEAMAINSPTEASMPEPMLLRAEVLVQNEFFDQAEMLLTSFVETFPHDVRPRRILAGLCIERGNTTMALAHLRMVMMFEPSDSTVRRTLANLLESSNPQEAVTLLLSDPQDAADPAIRIRAAALLATIGRAADAERLYRSLIREFPRDASLLIDAGELALQQGAIELATERLSAAVALKGRQRARAFAALGKATMRSGQPIAAARWWWKAAKRSDDRDAVLDAMAHVQVCALSVGRNTLVDRIRHRLAPTTTQADRRLALAHAWQDTAPSIDTQDVAEVGESPLITITRRAGQTLANHVATHSNYADAWYHDAVCKTTLGEYDDARRSVRQALRLNSHYEAAASLAANLGQSESFEREAA